MVKVVSKSINKSVSIYHNDNIIEICEKKDKQDYEVLYQPLRQSILQIINFKDKILL